MNKIFGIVFAFLCMSSSNQALARVDISPFASVSSTKKIKPADMGKEKSETKQKTVYGLRASASMYRLIKFEFELGQGRTETTSMTRDAADEFGEIDYVEDLNMSTSRPDGEVKVIETLRRGKIGLALDPSFSIFILKAKAGVLAQQRIVTLEQDGNAPATTEPPITYKPYAGIGAGVKLSSRIKCMAEYSLYFYKFPELKPFEREVTISFVVALGSSKGY